jgi:hypothetical protein
MKPHHSYMQLYPGKIQGVGVHNTSHVHYGLILHGLFDCIVEVAFKPLGFALWFKCPPLVYNSNELMHMSAEPSPLHDMTPGIMYSVAVTIMNNIPCTVHA